MPMLGRLRVGSPKQTQHDLQVPPQGLKEAAAVARRSSGDGAAGAAFVTEDAGARVGRGKEGLQQTLLGASTAAIRLHAQGDWLTRLTARGGTGRQCCVRRRRTRKQGWRARSG
jgi:hypothetical protein